jgi:murein DD-endopeptidase MepM/ murein hydrolase activator NlpD
MKQIAVLFAVLLAVPFGAAAQENDADWFSYWGRNSQYASQIQALGDTAVQSIPIPVLLGVEVNQLTRNFGDARGGGTRTHEGLDIMAPGGTPVVSPTDAVVLATGDGPDSGLFVRTANPGGEQFVYMHLREIAKSILTGATVHRGDVLGFVGNTGNASGGAPHLHFEIRKNGATDPYPRLTQSFSLQERMQSVQQALERVADPVALAGTLAENFRSTFTAAQSQGVSVAQSIISTLGSALTIGVHSASAQTSATMPNTTNVFTRDLEVGMKGEDVRTLQKYLNANGYLLTTIGDGAPGYETLMFGNLTKKALATFQRAKGISPAAGYFGPKTRAYISSH